MENNFQKIISRALEIKARYNKIEPKKWQIDQLWETEHSAEAMAIIKKAMALR